MRSLTWPRVGGQSLFKTQFAFEQVLLALAEGALGDHLLHSREALLAFGVGVGCGLEIQS